MVIKQVELIWDFQAAVLPGGKLVALDKREAIILREILRGGVVSQARLSRAAFGRPGHRTTIGVYVMRLRQKIGRAAIITVNGKGYRIGRIK